MGNALNSVFSGVLLMGYAVAALFFLRFWRDTRDRLFGIFAAAFFLLAAQRFALAVIPTESQEPALLYGVRLVAFLLILGAILDKNRAGR
jgi:peptidoglycan/LPS O-acetylase OafA/YrhL